MKFCVKLGKSTTETFAMLNMAYGDVAMKRATCFRWHKRFKNGRLSVEDDKRSGRPSTSTDDPHIDEINTLVQANRRLTVKPHLHGRHFCVRFFDKNGCGKVASIQ